jgi:two-component system, NtrC family, sensor kinase
MSVKIKLIAMVTFVAIVPLSVSAVSTLSIHQTSFDERLRQLYLSNARYSAKAIQSDLDSANKNLEALITGSIVWHTLSDDEKNGALWLIYGQLDSILAVSLLDQEGNGIGSSVYAPEGSKEYPQHPRTTLEDLNRFGRSIPFDKAKQSGKAFGTPFIGSGEHAVFIPLAFVVKNPPPHQKNLVAVAMSLAELCRALDEERLRDTAISLLDERGRYLCLSGQTAPLFSADASLMKHLANAAEGTVRYADEQGQDTLAAYAATKQGWKVVVRQPSRSALAPSVRMREQTMFWIGIGIIAAISAGLFLAQGINKPIDSLAKGAGKIATGDFTYRFEDHGGDEFGKLSNAFNHMCGEIAKRDTEIRVWNQQLQDRVEQRTQELKEAQSALLQSRKVAAMASLGAGVAHEINNPLTGVIGLTQLLIRKARENAAANGDTELLCQIEQEGLRIRDITHKMLRLSEDYMGGGFERLTVAPILDRVIDAHQTRIAGAAISVERNYAEALPMVFGNAQQLEEALTQVIDNAVTSMIGRGGQLLVSASTVEGELVKISIKDTGKGIEREYLDKIFEPFFTTKDDWKGEGLGLTLAFRIVETHHGTIKVASVVGEGTTVTITLPIVRPGAHLV